MRTKLGVTIGIMVLLFITAGCASIMSGKTQDVTINSSPTGATVYLNGKQLGKTPLSVKVDRPNKEAGALKFEKEGYKTLEIPYAKKMNSWLLGNILFGGTFGTTTDYASGAMYEYQPDFLQVTLEADGMSAIEKGRFRAQNELRYFILTNYGVLSEEIATGSGEYLSALLGGLKVDRSGHEAVVAALKEHLVPVGKAPTFADYLINTYYN